jgi:hypothetical protein
MQVYKTPYKKEYIEGRKMNKKISIAILALIMFAAVVGIAKAQIEAQIEIKDSGGNIISDESVPYNTVAYVYGTYVDNGGDVPASALMEAYYDDGSGWEYRATLFTGMVNDGETIVRTYTMTEHGHYQFRWRCRKEGAGTSGLSISCTQQVSMDWGGVFVIPEPATIAGLLMALSAFGLLAVKRTRAK